MIEDKVTEGLRGIKVGAHLCIPAPGHASDALNRES